ncbi:caspase family protein [Streptomyces bottropensis]|uniref:caspase family protein n=1 Tax=Streptomyces bottropensis TaxID=42235 RepID=UPI0036B0F2CA
MDRAVVLIGVRDAAGFPTLQAVDRGLHDMESWAKSQQIPVSRIEVVTDIGGDVVDAATVRKAVQSFASHLSVEQLIVYFCGHGVNLNKNEYWLLSEAPDEPNEAINVSLSTVYAWDTGVPHVVLISDACRTAPEGKTTGLIGQSLFRNGTSQTAWVDLFYACRPGEAAYEIADRHEASRLYRALYTEVLAKALGGDYSELLERVQQNSRAFHLVRPYPLKEHLPGYVSRRIIELGAHMSVNQSPEGRVTSGGSENAWLSRLPAAVGAVPSVTSDEVESGREVTPPEDPALDAASIAAERLTVPPSGPGKIKAPSAVQVDGNSIQAVYTDGTEAEQMGPDAVQVHVSDERRVANVLLHLTSGQCAVIPALWGRVATMVFEEDQLVDVSYAPLSEGTWGHREELDKHYMERRAQIAAASRYGLSWWEGGSPEGLVRLFEQHGEADPSLAIYLAYGLADLGRRDLVGRLLTPDNQAAGYAFYDVMLLAKDWGRPVVPFMPLVSRGWALLGPLTGGEAPDVPTPQASHWTLFSEANLPRLQDLLKK